MRRRSMDLSLISKAECSLTEKNETIKIIAEIIAMGNIVRRQGLLALEDVVNTLSCDFLKIGIRLIIDGIDPAMIEETMLKIVYTENFKGTELFKRLVIIEGVKAVQFGDNDSIAKIRLFSMFSEKKLYEALHESSEIDSELKKYNPFTSTESKVSETIKITSEPGTFKLMKYAFEETLNSLTFLEYLAGIYLFKDNQEALSSIISTSSTDRLLFFFHPLEPEVEGFKGKSLSIEELKELATLIQSHFLNGKESIVLAANNALRHKENLQTEYRNKSINEYEAELRSRVMEFFKVILSLMTEKRNFMRLSDSFLCHIIIYTIVDGKTAVNFVKEEKMIEFIQKRSIPEILQSIF